MRLTGGWNYLHYINYIKSFFFSTAGKDLHAYIPIKMASGVQDITCVFLEVAGSYEKNSNLTVSWDGV